LIAPFLFCAGLLPARTGAQPLRVFAPEQRTIRIRDPRDLPRVRLPRIPNPTTVHRRGDREMRPISLNDAIRVALANAEVVRFLSGQTASNSGRTIYDVAISNSSIDLEQARFDPNVSVQNSFNRLETPLAVIDPGDPLRAIVTGLRTDDYRLSTTLSKQMMNGAIAEMKVNTTPTRVHSGNGPLNPQSRSSFEIGLTQPLLQGAGIQANAAAIVIARINTERSYFQFKDSVQELVRGVVDAYWSVVSARVDVWARQQQVHQATEAWERAQLRFRVGRVDVGEPSQARVALAGFNASLVTSESNLLNREAALRSLLGMPPVDRHALIPNTPLVLKRLHLDWEELIGLAEINRPDLIELKLILDADTQLLNQVRNQALPRLDALFLYRWNGLEGEMLDGSRLRHRPAQFTDWTMAVNFSVPVGMRESRASLRRQELNIARDRANLKQSLHQIVHQLALNVRNLDQFYAQYEAFRMTREAARINLERQRARYEKGGNAILLDVLTAITSWGNAVSNEAQAIVQYNTELANLERQTGTILESHGVFFFEERYASLGPKGRFDDPQCYPLSLNPIGPADRYGKGEFPSEDVFDLQAPIIRKPIKLPPLGTELLPPPSSTGPERLPNPLRRDSEVRDR
jgi:outer membrane protein TolC